MRTFIRSPLPSAHDGALDEAGEERRLSLVVLPLIAEDRVAVAQTASHPHGEEAPLRVDDAGLGGHAARGVAHEDRLTATASIGSIDATTTLSLARPGGAKARGASG
jgi:hypothetical protein